MEQVLITRKDLALLQARACEVLEKSGAASGQKTGPRFSVCSGGPGTGSG
jgi:hypothetical protein